VSSDRPDIIIGLVCAAGTDLSDVKRQLKAQLAVVEYRCNEIKVSTGIASALKIKESGDFHQRTVQLMDGGDKLREFSENSDGVASLIVTQIRAQRDGKDTAGSRAFIVDSLKNPKEVEVLDQIYSRNYYTVAVYSPTSIRKDNLSNKISKGKHQPLCDAHLFLAQELIDRDQKGKSSHGQSVRDTFPKSDFFIDTQKDVSVQIKRFIELIFGEPFITPTLDEYMMFVAKATALRSCDLSRQVGAVIVDQYGAIVSTGCNEVPMPKGGFYYEGRENTIGDNRDKVEQHDPNFHEIERSIGELIEVMKEAGFIQKEESSEKLAEELIHGDHKELTAEARIRNLIEFGRVVHAEMHAISQAAMIGRSVKGATLYCTTYPCHICARHVIASGIDKVVYIEPYPKSLTASMYHREMISEGDAEDVSNACLEHKVVFRSFRGISPTLYQRVFTYRRRKDSYGAIAEWVPNTAKPLSAVSEIARPSFEAFVANDLANILDKIHSRKNGEEKESGDDQKSS
jgi:deoxycytidylate deaminase